MFVSPALLAQGIEYSYSSGSFSFNLPLLEIAAAQVIGLRGQSGTGKSTLLNLISGLQVPQRGRISVAGTEIQKLGEVERDLFRARHIGYVFQSFYLLEAFTVKENILLAMKFAAHPQAAAEKTAQEILHEVGLGQRLDYYPRQLSIGQRQRVAVARALVNKPPLLLADEPTGNLDPHTTQEVLNLLLQSASQRGAALMVVSHSPQVLEQLPTVLDLQEITQGTTAA